MWSYKIDSIISENGSLNVHYILSIDGKIVKTDNVFISANALAGQPSDGRIEYVQSVVAEACKKFMVVEDVKTDFSKLVGNEYTLDGVVYETKVERQTRIDAEIVAREALIAEATAVK
jgi:hypothetical protein